MRVDVVWGAGVAVCYSRVCVGGGGGCCFRRRGGGVGCQPDTFAHLCVHACHFLLMTQVSSATVRTYM